MHSSPVYSRSRPDAVASVQAVHAAALVTEDQAVSLVTQLEGFFDEVSSIQGDLYKGNALWDGKKVVSLLDFEFAVVAPVELDLNELAKHVFGPSANEGRRLASDEEERAVLDIAAGMLLHPPLLKAYAILLEAWFTQREINRLSLRDLQRTESCRRLVALADGDGGYLAPLLDT